MSTTDVIFLHSHPIKAVSVDALGHKEQMEILKVVTMSQKSQAGKFLPQTT